MIKKKTKKKQQPKVKAPKKEKLFKLDMTFDEAMSRILKTPKKDKK